MRRSMVEILDCSETSEEVAQEARRLCVPVGHPSTRLPLLCATSDGRLLGCTALIQPSQCTSANCAGVNVQVQRQHRRRGIGERLVTALMGRAQEIGYERLQAVIQPENRWSIHLFGKLGFEPAGQQETEVRLERALNR